MKLDETHHENILKIWEITSENVSGNIKVERVDVVSVDKISNTEASSGPGIRTVLEGP
jgi:hypothetical protein